MKNTVRKWWRGIFGAFIGGAAGAVQSAFSVTLVDPNDFNLESGVNKLLAVMWISIISGSVVGLSLYLAKSPLPPDDDDPPPPSLTPRVVGLLLTTVLSLPVVTACASLGPAVVAVAPTNPALPVEGRFAQVGTRIVDALGIGQAGLPTLARTKVLTAEEAIDVNNGIRQMLLIAEDLGTALKAIDAGRSLLETARQWDVVAAKVSELLRSAFSLGTGVAGERGREAVGGLLGKMADHLGELMAMAPDRVKDQVWNDLAAAAAIHARTQASGLRLGAMGGLR